MKKLIILFLILIVAFIVIPDLLEAGIFEDVKNKAVNISLLILQIMGGAAIIVKATPTKWDDRIFGKVNKFVHKIANFFTLGIGK